MGTPIIIFACGNDNNCRAPYLILQHALGQRMLCMYVCIFVRHAHLRMRARMAGA